MRHLSESGWCQRVARVGVVLAVAALGVVVAPTPAFGHAFPVTTTPTAGARLAASPSEISVHFSEAVVTSASRVTVRTSTGHVVGTGRLEFDDASTTLRVLLTRPRAAIYIVTWSVVADDGHHSEGEFAFAAGTVRGRPPAPRIGSSSIPVDDSIATALLLIGLALAVGGLCSERFVWRPAERDNESVPRAPVVAALVIGAVGAAAQLVLITRAQPGGVLEGTSWNNALAARPGILALGELVSLVYALWILRIPRFRMYALIPLVGAVLAAAFRGHSGVGNDWWAAPANALHFILAGLWVGALVHLVRVLYRIRPGERRATFGEASTRYASLALVVVPPLLAFGVLTALAEVDHLSDLTTTTYGVVLLVKLALVVGVLAVALTARSRGLRKNRINLVALRRLTRPEAITLLTIVAVSGILASTTPGSPAASAGYILGPPPLTGTVERSAELAGQLAVYLAATDRIVRLEVLAPGGEKPNGTRIAVEGTRPDGTSVALFPRRCGPACASMNTTWTPGITTLTATVAASGWTGGKARLTVAWPPAPDATSALTRVIAAMRAQPRVEIHEQVTSDSRREPIPNAAELTGAEFMAQELYANGGATDVRALPSDHGLQNLTFTLPASDLWLRLWYDDAGLIRRELIVDPGHRIARTFEYPSATP